MTAMPDPLRLCIPATVGWPSFLPVCVIAACRLRLTSRFNEAECGSGCAC